MNHIVKNVYLGTKRVGMVLTDGDGYFYRNGSYSKRRYHETKDGQIYPTIRECMRSVSEDCEDVRFV